jgi:hypothetical protein
METKPQTDQLLTVIQWTLQRLLSGDYEVTLDSAGNPERLEVAPEFGVRSLEAIEEDLKVSLPSEHREKLFALRDQRTPEQVRAALEDVSPLLGFHLGTAAFENLLRAEWAEIVTSMYWADRRFHDDLMSSVIASRIGLGDPATAKFENLVQMRMPDALPGWAGRYVVREMSEMLPAVVERLLGFQVTPVRAAVPTNVAQYARDASRCYLYGLLSASLILCRSCIETGIQDRLIQKGLQKRLDAIGYNKVQELLGIAFDSGVLDDLTVKMADDIRRSANRAVHGKVPAGPDCREKLEQTRAILRHLYE